MASRSAAVAGSPGQWRHTRREMIRHRHPMAGAAASLYPGIARVEQSVLLCRPQWLPERPLPLDQVTLAWTALPPAPAVDGLGQASAHVRPWREDSDADGGGRAERGGQAEGAVRYGSYAEAVAAVDPPAQLENRLCYRLLHGAVSGCREPAGAVPVLALASCRYFDGVNLGHAVAHEFAAAWLESPDLATLGRLPLRALTGDPCDLSRRCAVPAVTTLTLRRSGPGEASFLLHWRDPAKVNHAGGLYQVVPAGIFQPVTAAPTAMAHDLSLWRCMVREFSEELLGTPEEYPPGPGGRLDYDRWPFHQRLAQARGAGRLTVWFLGIGVDPLTLATDILTVAVFEDDLFDEVFAELVTGNSEGRLVPGPGGQGIPFTAAAVSRYAGGGEPMQPAGAALLQLAWHHRHQLLA